MGSARTSLRRIVVAAALWLVVGGLGAPSAAAATCAISAPTSVNVGSGVTISGSGFPAGSSVGITVKINNGDPDSFSVAADATGAFTMQLTTEASDIGRTSVKASVAGGCSDQLVYAVVDPNAPPPPATPEPASGGAAAGGAAGTGAVADESGPPRTDAAMSAADAPTSTASLLLVVGVLVFVIGFGGLVTTRPAPRR